MKQSIIFLLLLAASTPLFGSNLDFTEASKIVIQSGGRKKPLDTFASESLQTLSGRQTLKDPQTGKRIQAMDAFFSIWFGTRDWKNFSLILVPHAALRERLGLPLSERSFSFQSLMQNKELSGLYQLIQAKRAENEELTPLEKEAEIIFGRMQLLADLMSGDAVTILPNPQNSTGKWFTPLSAVRVYGSERGARILNTLKNVSDAYSADNPTAFNNHCRELRQILTQLAPANTLSTTAIEREIHYNHLHPFRWAWLLYLASFLLLLFKTARRVGVGLFAAALLVHVYGLALRCLIAGRPPVTNMYESVIWVSLGVAGFAMVFSLIYRARIYLLAAAPLAVLGLILADSFPSALNPSIGPLPPVLRDNFWLVTHVLTITLSYAAFAMAMGLAHVILGRTLFKPTSIDEQSDLHHLLYRILQLGVLLLAVGTILGGVWANYSWGRFWGWDPKETWALIALLLYIFAIHGRMVRWWGNFGLSVAAVVCFNGVLMAWYGVNFVLGKGLHSYGFGGGGVGWVAGFVGLDLVFVGICIAARRKIQNF